MIWTGPHADLYGGVREHEELSAALTGEQRAWLRRMADVLPPGWVVKGMVVPRPGGVVPDLSYPGGCRLVVPPPGPSGASRPGHPRPHGQADTRALAARTTVPRPPPRPSPGRRERR